MRWRKHWLGLALLVLSRPVGAAEWSFIDLWLTREQQAQGLFEQGEFAAAAERSTDPLRRGAALYRLGNFAEAAAAFGRVDSAEASYNRGNALVMQGQYQDAIASYERALQMRPDWPEAQANRELALARQVRLAPPEDDAGGTGGMLGADEIVIDTSGRVAKSDNTEIVQGGQPSEAELRAQWLRRVQTRPADFLRAKFAYQRAMQKAQPSESASPGEVPESGND